MILLVTKTDPDAGHRGFSLFLVPMDTPGVSRAQKLRKMGMHASDTALLSFEDVWVDDSALLGTVGKGFEQIMWELQAERLIGAAGCLAYGQYAFDKTLTYARERHTFGRPLGQHQAIRHKFADMATRLEGARALDLPDGAVLRRRRVPGAGDLDEQAAGHPGRLGRGRPVRADPRRRRLHGRVRRVQGAA